MSVEFYGAEKLNENALLGALRTIRAARKELHLQTVRDPTPSALVSQIELYDVLLGEIRAVHACLGGRVRGRAAVSRRRAVARCARSGRYLAISRAEAGKNHRGDPRQEMDWELLLPSGGGS
jgi:hypothetical protein